MYELSVDLIDKNSFPRDVLDVPRKNPRWKVPSYAETNKNMGSSFFDVTTTFNNLYAKWKQETFLMSSPKIFDNINYQKIIALGKGVLPTLISNLDGSSTFLFFALHKITNENPVQTEHYGDIAAMVKDWKDWWEVNKKSYA
jgi:hypothetical protein